MGPKKSLDEVLRELGPNKALLWRRDHTPKWQVIANPAKERDREAHGKSDRL